VCEKRSLGLGLTSANSAASKAELAPEARPFSRSLNLARHSGIIRHLSFGQACISNTESAQQQQYEKRRLVVSLFSFS
jgi:hypothetical protein